MALRHPATDFGEFFPRGGNPDERVDILLVDDSPANLLSMEELLSAPDLRFIKALSGEKALEATLHARPALILLDVQMPGMDGFEVARLLRSTQRTRDIPIIFVTATQREEKLTFKGFESGAVDYLLKPLNPVIVRSKVAIFVELYRNRMLLERTVRDLKLTNQELESFSYSVSHDLRAPLRAILGFTESAMRGLSVDQNNETVKALTRVMSAAGRMGNLIDGLLDLARVTGASVRSSELDLSAMARRICGELQHERGLPTIDCRIADGLKTNGDQRLFESVLRNLLGNALKFAGKGETPLVEFGASRDQSGEVFFVRDNGVGFDMKHSERLFGAFQRLHDETEFAGTGIGLATVQRIIHRHGGRIWAESRPNEGATFYFTVQ